MQFQLGAQPVLLVHIYTLLLFCRQYIDENHDDMRPSSDNGMPKMARAIFYLVLYQSICFRISGGGRHST